jgi:hypothetical protein
MSPLYFKSFNLVLMFILSFNLVIFVSFVICDIQFVYVDRHLEVGDFDSYQIETVETSKLMEMTNLCK